MSTECGKIQSANEYYPNDTLEFVTGVNGNYFFLEFKDVGTHKGYSGKFWFNKESWDKLKSMVEAHI